MKGCVDDENVKKMIDELPIPIEIRVIASFFRPKLEFFMHVRLALWHVISHIGTKNSTSLNFMGRVHDIIASTDLICPYRRRDGSEMVFQKG